jgi:5-oxoprolinase (ATP-hydrolysing) subunit A
MVRDATVLAVDGSTVQVRADTVCIHGDKPTAVPFVRALRDALASASVQVARRD